MDQMITSEEALKLYHFATIEDLELAWHIFNACVNDYFSLYAAVACVYNAGRVEGVREERARNKKREKARKEREKYGYVSGAGTIPAFRNHHWNLYNSCCYKATQAMSAYYKAQREWLESPEGIETMRRIEEYEEYIKQK